MIRIKKTLLVVMTTILMFSCFTTKTSAILGIGLKIKVVDSVTSSPIQGAVYEVCENNLFATNVSTITTDINGEATLDDLTLGVWYMRQKTAPTGYIQYTDIIPVSIGTSILTLNLKLTPYGKIEIEKVDNKDNVVQGAVFSLFTGSLTTGIPIETGITTGIDGKVVIPDITPGTYALLETSVPEGYHLNVVPVVFEVLAGNTKQVKVVNTLVERATLNLYKRDAINNMQLAGAKFAVYKDIGHTQLVSEVTSLESAPAVVDNLLPGTYYIKETQVPSGYLMDALDQSVILLEGETKDVTFLNNRSYPTAGNFAGTLFVGLGMLITCGIVFVVYRKRNK